MLSMKNLDTFLKRIDLEIRDLERQDTETAGKQSETFYDDLCLARFMKGCLEREKMFHTKESLVDITIQVRHGIAFNAAMDGATVPEDCKEYTPSEETVSAIRYSILNLESVLKQSALIKVLNPAPYTKSTITGSYHLRDTN
jgi:hypothetical protein